MRDSLFRRRAQSDREHRIPLLASVNRQACTEACAHIHSSRNICMSVFLKIPGNDATLYWVTVLRTGMVVNTCDRELRQGDHGFQVSLE